MGTYAAERKPALYAGDHALKRAQQLRPLLESHAESHDASGQLDGAVIDALHDNGLFGLWVPAALGGSELDPVRSLEVIEAVAHSDPSTAWVMMAAALTTGCAGAYLADDAVAQMFGGERFPVTAGQGSRPGRAVSVEGGYRLTGSWNFGSGLKHASYVHSLAQIEGSGLFRIFIVPVGQAQIDRTSWDVMGLRGTGSLDYRFDDIFVPAGFSYASTSVSSSRGGRLYGLGTLQFALVAHCGWALGVARRLLDELVRSRGSRPFPPGDLEVFQSELAGAEAAARSSRAFVFDAWNDIWNALAAGDEVTRRQRTAIRLATHNATRSAVQVSEFVYRSAGTASLRAGVIQRFYRDMHAGAQHVTSGPGVLRECGRELAGLAGDAQWVNLVLVGG